MWKVWGLFIARVVPIISRDPTSFPSYDHFVNLVLDANIICGQPQSSIDNAWTTLDFDAIASKKQSSLHFIARQLWQIHSKQAFTHGVFYVGQINASAPWHRDPKFLTNPWCKPREYHQMQLSTFVTFGVLYNGSSWWKMMGSSRWRTVRNCSFLPGKPICYLWLVNIDGQ